MLGLKHINEEIIVEEEFQEDSRHAPEEEMHLQNESLIQNAVINEGKSFITNFLKIKLRNNIFHVFRK